MKRAISDCLYFCLFLTVGLLVAFANCAPKVNVNPNQTVQKISSDDILRAAKTFGLVLSDAINEAIPFENALAQNGTIDKEIEPGLRQALSEAKKAVDDFNTRAARYEHFDAASEADINKFRDDAIAFIDRMNNEGVLHIKNPRSQLIATGILAGVKIAVRIYDAE